MPTVLVVDDEFGVAEVIEAILEDEGYRVLTAVNGKQGLERLAEAQVDLVVLDVMMPILDGPGMLKRMRAEGFAAVPVVMMSSLPESVVREQAPHAQAFLRKPFRAQAVADIVRSLIGPGNAPA